MFDKNIVLLEGVIGDDYKYSKTTDGKEYATFSLCVNSFMREIADKTERTRAQTFVRIFVYDKRLVEYLHNVNAHRGQRASIFGRVVSHMCEYKGHSYLANNITCRDIVILKTRKDPEEVEVEVNVEMVDKIEGLE